MMIQFHKYIVLGSVLKLAVYAEPAVRQCLCLETEKEECQKVSSSSVQIAFSER